MARSRHSTPRPDRFHPIGAGILLTMFTVPVVQYLVAGNPTDAATTALGRLGFVVVCLVAGFARSTATEDDQHRLNVLTLQALGAITVALIAHQVWAPEVAGVPAMVALAGVGTIVLAGEALAIALRGRSVRA